MFILKCIVTFVLSGVFIAGVDSVRSKKEIDSGDLLSFIFLIMAMVVTWMVM